MSFQPYLAPCFFCIFLNSLFLSSSSSLFNSFSLKLALSALFFAARFSSAVSSGGASSLCRVLNSLSRSRSTVFRVLTSFRATYLSGGAIRNKVWTYIWFDEVLPVHEVDNVQSDLDPCLDSLDLLAVLWLVACHDDLSGSELGGEGSLARSSGGNIGDLKVSKSISGKWGGTYQEVLEDSVGLGVNQEFRETDIGGLEDDISHVRVLGEKSMGDGDGSEVMQPSKSLQVSLTYHPDSDTTHQVPSVRLGLSHSTLVDNRPNTKSFSLSSSFSSTEGKVEEQSLGVVVSRFDDRLESVHDQSHGVVER